MAAIAPGLEIVASAGSASLRVLSLNPVSGTPVASAGGETVKPVPPTRVGAPLAATPVAAPLRATAEASWCVGRYAAPLVMTMLVGTTVHLSGLCLRGELLPPQCVLPFHNPGG